MKILGNIKNRELTPIFNYLDPSIFDATYYFNAYPDLKAAFKGNPIDAASHWINAGIAEGRQASATFNVKHYLTLHDGALNISFGYSGLPANQKNIYVINSYLTTGKSQGDRAIINVPTITLTVPANNASLSGPVNLSITADIAGDAGTVTKVEFYNGNNLLGTLPTNNPYNNSTIILP